MGMFYGRGFAIAIAHLKCTTTPARKMDLAEWDLMKERKRRWTRVCCGVFLRVWGDGS